MLSAIISDTLLLKSPTCTEHDLKAFEALEKIAGIDAKDYGLKMLKAGTDTSALSAKEIIADINDVFSRKEDLSFAMEKEIADKNLNLCILVITDIINTNSRIIALGKDKELVEKAFNQKLDVDDSMLLEGVVSRKKQIAPPLLAVL